MTDPAALTDEELADVQERFARAERWQWQISSCGESLDDVPRLIAALHAERAKVKELEEHIADEVRHYLGG